MQIFDPADITDSSSTHSDDTTSGGCGGGAESSGGRTSRGARLSAHANSARRRKNALNAKERNLRRLESNERERMRMHSLNDAFQVCNTQIPREICGARVLHEQMDPVKVTETHRHSKGGVAKFCICKSVKLKVCTYKLRRIHCQRHARTFSSCAAPASAASAAAKRRVVGCDDAT